MIYMTAAERLEYAGYEDVVIFTDYSYDDALIGVTNDNRAVYDYEKMIDWLVKNQDFTVEDAYDWIDYNTIRALPYAGPNAPIIIYPLPV